MARATTSSAGGILGARKAGVVLALTALAASIALGLGPGAAPAAAKCRHVDAHPHQASLAKLRDAITCLVNHQRSKRDRHALDPNASLRLAARRHNHKMLAQDCFRHRCHGEVGLNRRVKRSGYTDGEAQWQFAEVLGFAVTPREMIRRFMHNNFSRKNVLNPDFRDIGVGVGWGTPVKSRDDSNFATYTLVVGWRKP